MKKKTVEITKGASELESNFETDLDSATTHFKSATKYFNEFNSKFDDNRYYEEAKRAHAQYQDHIENVRRYVNRAFTHCEASLVLTQIDSHEKDT